jgi:transposase
MKPYSLDLRQKIIEVYTKEKISGRQLAIRFKRLFLKKCKGEGSGRSQTCQPDSIGVFRSQLDF